MIGYSKNIVLNLFPFYLETEIYRNLFITFLLNKQVRLQHGSCIDPVMSPSYILIYIWFFFSICTSQRTYRVQYDKCGTNVYSYMVLFYSKKNSTDTRKHGRETLLTNRPTEPILLLILDAKLEYFQWLLNRAMLFHSLVTMLLLHLKKYTILPQTKVSYLPHHASQDQELNIPNKLHSIFNNK